MVKTVLAAQDVSRQSWRLKVRAETMDSTHEEVTEEVAQSEKWVVAYAKILLDKDTGVSLHGIYFGGIGDTPEDAEKIARECVNTIKGGTIIPKVLKIDDKFSVIDALYEAADRFEDSAKRMQEAESIIKRGKNK